VLNVVEMPIKCPVAPLEFLFLADAYFTQKGMRDKVEIVYATPLEGAFTKPKARRGARRHARAARHRRARRLQRSEVDGEKRTLKAYDGRETNYDLLVTIPLHGGAEVDLGAAWATPAVGSRRQAHAAEQEVHQRLRARRRDRPALVEGRRGRALPVRGALRERAALHRGQAARASFDGHANCFIETGYGKAMLIDFNYDTEPLPGRFPLPGVGPFTLLEESATTTGASSRSVGLLERPARRQGAAPRPPHAHGREVELKMDTRPHTNNSPRCSRLDAIDAQQVDSDRGRQHKPRSCSAR
jgi:sulfide:quinone oxidoreductase